MKQIVLLLAAFFSFQILPAQDVTYVLFNRDCMNQLEYRYSYPNLKGENAVWAYSVKPNLLEHYVFMTEGAGHYSPEQPEGTVTCRNLDLNDAFVASINRGDQQMLIVFQRQSGGYWLMPVESATLVARKASKYWVRAKQSSFQFDTLHMVNEQNLAVAGSPTAAYFSGAKLNNCLMEYSFHCQPVKSGQIRSDFQFIPSIGIVNDRTGTSASTAMENELQLVKVNGVALDDYITEACPEGSGKIAMSKYQKPANYGNDSFEPDKEMASIMQKEQDNQSPATYDVKGIQCAEDWEPGTHIVQKKENLRAIARTYKVSEQDLIKWNNIQNPDLIEVCQKLWLKPPPTKAAKKTTTNKAVKAQVYDAQPEKPKTVKMQGTVQGQKGITSKAYDPNRPLEYSNGSANDDYQYASEKTGTDTRPKIHIVHRGEYLYKIAKMYGCPEECIRIANAMPLEGDEPLTIGQEIIIPACTCTLDGKPVKKPSATTKKPTVKKQGLSNDSQGYSQPKKGQSILDESEAPAEYNYDNDRVYKDEDRYQQTSLYDEDASSDAGSKNKVQLYKEHLVRQGETLRSIAAKYKVDSGKLGKLNKDNLTDKGEPISGKTFLIPIEEKGTSEEDVAPYTTKPTPKKEQGYNPYNYEDVESPASYSASTTKAKKSPSTGTTSKKSSTSNKSFSPAEYDSKQKPRSILDDDMPEDKSSSQSYSKPLYTEDDRDDQSGKEIVKPKTQKTSKIGGASTDPKSTQHVVKKGETIQSIADKYDVSPYELSQINNIAIDDSLIPGKKIWIPVENGK